MRVPSLTEARQQHQDAALRWPRAAPERPVPEVDGRPLRILQVGTLESGGGAAGVANALRRAYRARGCESWLAVRQTATSDRDVFVIPDDRRLPYRASGYTAIQARLRQLASLFPGTGWGLINRTLRQLTHPRVWIQRQRGVEDFEYPGTYDLLDLPPKPPDLVHCHNLHGGFFDLRALAWLSRRLPTVWTLHDMWPLTGHCAHSLGCERWRTGCGACPDLALYPAVRRDATAENWRRKRDLYADSRLYVAAPSRWLVDRAKASILAPAMRDVRVIPHGVDLAVFKPADRRAVRARLGLPADAHIVLLTGGSNDSAWKDRHTLKRTMAIVAERAGADVLFLALEDGRAPMTGGSAAVRFVGYQSEPGDLARFYQAADVYLHSARADTFPTMVIEALACGTPVVATGVGGVPEQIAAAELAAVESGEVTRVARATGVIVDAGDAAAMADATLALLANDAVRQAMGEQAVRDARRRFDQDRQIAEYLAWYRDILDDWAADRGATRETHGDR